MRKVIGDLGLTFIWVCLVWILSCRGVEAQTVIKVVGNHAPPYRIIKGDEFSGIYNDTMKELGRRMGVEIHFANVPFARALMMMKQGKNADIMLGPNRNPQRESYMVYTQATFSRENKAFYVHPDSPGITKYEDLRGKNISVHRGKIYFSKFDQDTSLIKEPVSEYIIGIRKVAKKRNDVIVMPEKEGGRLLKEHSVKLKKSSYIVKGEISYITISKKSPVLKLQERLEETMEQIKKDGTMKAIRERYK